MARHLSWATKTEWMDVPRAVVVGGSAKHVSASTAPGVPIAYCEAQPVAHGLAHDLLLCIVVLERQRVLRAGTCTTPKCT